MRPISKIILHCSASSIPGQRVSILRSWHKARGFKDVGYQYFIGFDGKLERGRPLDSDAYIEAEEIGAHTLGHNKDSIGICLAGLHVFDFTSAQFETLEMLLILLHAVAPKATLHGHREFTAKDCPVFDYRRFVEFWSSL